MTRPPRLRPGDRIGIVAPSGPVLRRYVVAGLKVLEAAGYRPRLSRHLYDRRGHLAGTDARRAEDLNRMLRDPDIRCVLMARGGFGAMRIAGDVDWGAMMFLLAANRLSRGYARLRQWLIMAFRMLAIAGLIFAIARPLASGWLGLSAGGRPDPVRRPSLGAGGGGLSGAAIRPVAVRAVYDCRQAFPEAPIVGVGGVRTGADAVELLMAGADAVQVGTATFFEPRASLRVLRELGAWCARHRVEHVRDLRGAAHG